MDCCRKNQVIQYLRDSHSTGYSFLERLPCHICNEYDALSSQDMSDGVWVFPEELIHYIEQHDVVPEKEFMEHIRRNNYKVPELPDRFKIQKQ